MPELADYTPTTWTNSSGQPINAPNLSHIESAVDTLNQFVREAPLKKARAATTANITLSGTQTIDTVPLAVGDPVLVKDQSAPTANGYYIVAAGSWTRAQHADTGSELAGGSLITVAEGNVNGGATFICTTKTAVTIGSTALTFTKIPTTPTTGAVYLTDNTTPLKYSAFLAAAGGNQQNALQTAVNALYASSGNYRRFLDLEGALITLTSPVTLPASVTNERHTIHNGKIVADSTLWGSADYLLDFTTSQTHQLKLVRVDMDGKSKASWLYWTTGDIHVIHCDLENPKLSGTAGVTGPPGLNCDGAASAGLWVYGGRWNSPEFGTAPSSRQTVAIRAASGDNKFFGVTASYFRHWLIGESGAYQIDNCHPFGAQTGSGTTENDHTASIKLTDGYTSTTITNLYLGKSYIEISNETAPTSTRIGGLTISGMRNYVENEQAGYAAIVAKDYGNLTAVTVVDVAVTGCNFNNFGSVVASPTKLDNPTHFDRTAFAGIIFRGNTFNQPYNFQSNPCTREIVFASLTQHTFDYNGYMPFDARPYAVVHYGGIRSGGTAQIMEVGQVNRAGETVRIDTPSAWAGTMQCTVTGNVSQAGAQAGGFMDG